MKTNATDHQIETTENGLAFCTRCKGGEIELEESCAERLARKNAKLLDAAQKSLIWFEAFQPSFPPSTAVGSTIEGTIEILRAAIFGE